VDAERAKLAVQVSALHADALGQLANFAVTQNQLLLQVSTLEMLARLAKRQGQQILFDQRLIGRRVSGELALDLVEANFFFATENQQPLHEIPQLANVAGPGIVAQAILGSDAEATERQMLFVDQPIDVVPQK